MLTSSRQAMISIVPKSGAALHKILVESTMQAPMSFFDTIDSSIIVNRFSQDMTLVDGALPSMVFGIFMSKSLSRWCLSIDLPRISLFPKV